jgi:hypothetical protein
MRAAGFLGQALIVERVFGAEKLGVMRMHVSYTPNSFCAFLVTP